MSISIDDLDSYLEHFGVKGQKWGVRRAEKKAAKADAKWQDNIYSMKGAIAIHNRVADKMNAPEGLARMNAQPKYDKLDAWRKPDAPLSKQYMKEYEAMNERFTAEAVKEIHGSSPSGGYSAKLDTTGEQWAIKIVPSTMEHADIPNFELTIEVEHDDSGFVTSQRLIKDEVVQSDDMFKFLEHFGIKGMRWGVSKKPTRISPSEDAKKYAGNRKKHVSELGDKDLRDYINRLNMEQQYSKLTSPSRKGENYAKQIVATASTITAVAKLASNPTVQAFAKGFASNAVKALHKPAQAILVKSLGG